MKGSSVEYFDAFMKVKEYKVRVRVISTLYKTSKYFDAFIKVKEIKGYKVV